MMKPFRVGVALGGGAARAFSHVGVLAGLARHGIPIDIVTGTSMGSVIGAMYATHRDVAAIEARFAAYIDSEAFEESGFDFVKELDSHDEGILAEMGRRARRGVFNALMVTRTALVNDKTAAESYDFLIDDIRIEETRIPFAAVALDLESGEAVVLDRGRLRAAVAASCAMPGVLNPVEVEGRLLVDGGWVETVPIRAARQLGADFVIAVDVGESRRDFEAPRSALDVIARADALARSALNREQLREADIVIAPPGSGSHWADFSSLAQAVRSGGEEIERRIDAVKREMRRARWRRWVGLGGGRR